MKKVIAEFKADEKRKYAQKINRTNAIATLQDSLVGIFIKKKFEQGLEAFDKIVYQIREIIRPGRKNPRKHRAKKNYSMNYKKI